MKTQQPAFRSAGTVKKTVRSLDTFRDWLHHEIAKSSDMGFGGVDFSKSIRDHGMSSVHTVRLAGELEKLLDLEIEATLLYTFESIEAMCETLFRMRDGIRFRRADEVAALPVRLAATFTAEPVLPPIRHLFTLLGMEVEVAFAGYNQVFQTLLNPEGAFAGASGVNVALLRLEDLFRHGQPPSPRALERTVSDLCGALVAHGDRGGPPTLVALAPHSPHSVRALELGEVIEALDARILATAAAVPGLIPLDLRRVYEDYPVMRIWDEARDRLGHIPFSQGCYSAIGAGLARRIASVLTAPAKVIVLDCDNTLWGGVVGEDGPEGIRLTAPFMALQRFMVAQCEAGKLLCLASKNNDADVMAAFEARPEMPLRPEHIVARRVNWAPKSQNIAALAEELNLGLDSFVFVDDNPMEIAEVSEALPQVMTVALPSPPRIAAFLDHHWAFDHGTITEEDRRRTERVRQSARRSEVQATTSNIDAFIARLELRVDLAPLDLKEDIERGAQLTHRTNQFNAAKRVMGEAELLAFCRTPGRRTWRARVTDRFGDYGFVGLVSGIPEGDAWVCDVFLMSCRVLGRRVEQTLVRRLAADGADAGCETLRLTVATTARNVPVRHFFDSLRGERVAGASEGAYAVHLNLGEIEAHLKASTEVTLSAEATAPPPPSPTASLRAQSSGGYAEVAKIGPNVDALMTAVATTSRTHRPALSTPYVTPRDLEEKTIAKIWREVLGIDRVGVHDNFYELGGDSVRAAEAFARMWDIGIPESISLQTIMEPTVSVLAQAVRDVEGGKIPELLADHFSLGEEGHLPADICRPGYDPSTYDRPMARVLLTGATGYLGAYLIQELMTQTDATILCLVRASTQGEGRGRIVTNLRRYALWDPAYEGRLEVVLGDLTAPWLGLGSPALFAALANDIDSILHCAAWVNFVYPYQHLKATNVTSTETVLRLAVAGDAPIQVHFVSTLGVIMSTGYGRDALVKDADPLTHCDDLLNGYEQTKYVSDKMVWQAFKERGIPGAIYRPGMVSGLSDGTYHKLDEFLPQFLKGCIQLGAWPLLDTTWEMAPVDYTCQAIVHIAKRPANLNKAYFVVHPESRPVSDYIDWHREAGYDIRGLPWDVWKRELLGLGTERLRKNGLFPFVDFIRALSEEQIYFPTTGRAQFEAATADMDCPVPDALELLARYTQHFIDCDYYEKLPSGPRSRRPNEQAKRLARPGDLGQRLDERLRFDGVTVGFAEAYYVLFNIPERGQSFVVRYVLQNGILEQDKLAEVWCMFRDRFAEDADLAIRYRYPVGHAQLLNTEETRLRIGPCGYGDGRVWGRVESGDGTLEWDLDLDKSEAIAIERIPQADDYDLLPHFQSNGVKQHLSGTVRVNGRRYDIGRTLASDGHYWNTKNLRSWAWAHCAHFEGDPDFLFEGIGTRFNDTSQTSMWLTFIYKGERIESNIIDAFQYNQELDSGTASWGFVAERGNLRFVGEVHADPKEMNLLIHPLPDDEYLYTHICYEADMTIDIERKSGLRWWKTEQRVAKGAASFEVTRKVRNPEVTREFKIVRVK